MRHAYLILAHNDISLLTFLISCLDDSRNDIYIHWDAKSGAVPSIRTVHSNLCFIDNRVAVNWAGYSMVEAEFRLFNKAFQNGPYAYYHLLSGTDLPIKSQDYIHSVCEAKAGTEFIAFADASKEELAYRVQHYFLFPEQFKGGRFWKRALRKMFLLFQNLIGCHRLDVPIRKGSQWCSVTHDFVRYLLSQELTVKKWFHHTFCPDELFIQTLCTNSPFMDKVQKAQTEFEGNMRFIKWREGQLLPITSEDIPALQSSERWFARKFSSDDKDLVRSIQHLINNYDICNRPRL